MIITLMGIDGCGKSSLAGLLQTELTKRGHKSVVAWATLEPVILRPFIWAAKRIMVRRHDKFADYRAHDSAKKSGMRRLRFLHGIYFFVMLLDYFPQVIYKVTIPYLAGRYVICDRYFHDLMLYYAVTINGGPETMRKRLRVAGWLFPRPDLLYYISVPPELALARKSDVPSAEYLKERESYYRAMLDMADVRVLDGTLPLGENCARLLSDIEKREERA